MKELKELLELMDKPKKNVTAVQSKSAMFAVLAALEKQLPG